MGFCWLSGLLLITSLQYIIMQHIFFLFFLVETATISQSGDYFQPGMLGETLRLSLILIVEWSQIKALLS